VRYLGGKSRYAKHIIPHFGDLREKVYVEPFCGGCSVIAQVEAARRIANDVHPNLIALLSAVAEGWEPPAELSLAEWQDLRALGRSGAVAPLIGFAGFPCSYGGRWFEGYARTRRGDNSSGVAAVARAALLRQAPQLKGIEWHCGSYDDLDIPEGSVIYCDPPYVGTKGYSGTDAFDPHRFNYWCEGMKDEMGCTIYLSEQFAYTPRWRELWCQERSSGLDQDGERKVVVEKLFQLGAV
jgi:DNA adenine methylase